ncbi:TonB-dependent receptor [Lutibacter sp. B1]|uniref:TonB-dependent receptor n=1 Tax=Lutibacter sp. B1 TaxID=2725996 RepID=UPI001457758A|nr:TonB-dependent receptor [Lutibacter sp. B1]NLP57844.1 TonB-dependent receptor [Lutibacter sp. B1]
MKKIFLFIRDFVFVASFLITSFSFAQNTSITGVVTGSFGEPLPGVNIAIKGSVIGTISDMEGKYILSNVEKGNYTIEFSYIGFKTVLKELKVEGTDLVVNVVLIEDVMSLDDVVITGIANPRSRIESSISVTTMKPEVIKQSAPRSTAEIFRTIPGIRSESSGGEGNANIAVRGVPISSGGSKYVQIQEDGLPVLLYGDISFATADIFTRFDSNIRRIEAIRGGSASTLSSNSPGGIINIISKTGKEEGGSVGTTFGADYNSFRTDFDYGAPIGNGLYFHIGGFYRGGEGVRETDFTANNGGQLKFNITKEFEKGYVRIYTKFLDDKAAAYMPMPVKVTGSNSDPDWKNVHNFDVTHGALQSSYLTQNNSLGAEGNIHRTKVSEGMHPVSSSVGIEASFELNDGWKIKNNGRYSSNSGHFIAPFPGEAANTASIISESFGEGSTLTYATDGSLVDGNQLVHRIVMFDTKLNDFNNFMNDLRITKSFENLDITVGYFKSIQNLSMTWMPNTYLQEVSDNNARLINIFDSSGNLLTDNGLVNYHAPWGGSYSNYDTEYNVSAPYANVSFEASDKITLDGSIRYDKGKVDGSFAGMTNTEYDINKDGEISVPEQSVAVIDYTNATPVNYDYDYVSFSVGANYKLKNREAVFLRYSRGASAKADRVLFSGLDYFNGDKVNDTDFLNQAELGYKKGFENGALYATAFYAKTEEEGGYEVTSNSIIENDYKSFGIELEGFYNFNNFNLRGALTWTDAEIDSGENDGNTPRRQPDFIYNIIPSYSFGNEKQNSVGLSFVGQTKAYAQDSNKLEMPGFVLVNGFITVGITESLYVNLAANNIFDSIGITEAEEGSITKGVVNYVRARSLPGRSISASLTYNF